MMSGEASVALLHLVEEGAAGVAGDVRSNVSRGRRGLMV